MIYLQHCDALGWALESALIYRVLQKNRTKFCKW